MVKSQELLRIQTKPNQTKNLITHLERELGNKIIILSTGKEKNHMFVVFFLCKPYFKVTKHLLRGISL